MGLPVTVGGTTGAFRKPGWGDARAESGKPPRTAALARSCRGAELSVNFGRRGPGAALLHTATAPARSLLPPEPAAALLYTCLFSRRRPVTPTRRRALLGIVTASPR